MEENSNSPVRSVDRALFIVETLAKYGKGLGLVDLSREVGLNKTTTYRILCAIMSHGWVIKDPNTGNYRLTLKLFEIGSKVTSSTNLLTIVRPLIEDLSSKIGETIHLVVRDGTDVVYIFKEESSIQSIKMGSQVGTRNPMFVTGVGKAILSYLDIKEVKELWNSYTAIKRTANTIVDLNKMHEDLRLSKFRGWALDDEENEVGVRCIAVPILSRENNPIAAMSISGSVFHITPDKYEEYSSMLISIANSVSMQLGV